MIKNILRLTRPKQWIKNFFVFIPMFFGGELFNLHSIELVTLTFFAYSFVASSIYCYNDIVDVDADRNHPVKCQRPIASGALSIRMGYTLMIVMFVLGIGVALTLPPEVMSNVMAVIVFYYVLNLAYCSKLKQYAVEFSSNRHRDQHRENSASPLCGLLILFCPYWKTFINLRKGSK